MVLNVFNSESLRCYIKLDTIVHKFHVNDTILVHLETEEVNEEINWTTNVQGHTKNNNTTVVNTGSIQM